MTNSVWDKPHLTGYEAQEPEVDPDVITVYNMRFCPYAERTILVLLAKKIRFQVVNIHLKEKPKWFLEQTWGTVPVVRHRGEFIKESLITSDYIDEMFPESSLHPVNPMEKAKGRCLVELFSKMNVPFYKLLLSSDSGDDDDKETKQLRDKLFKEIKKTLVSMDNELSKSGNRYLSGPCAGMTDLMVWPWMERMEALLSLYPSVDRKFPDELTSLQSWMVAMRDEDCVRQYGLTPAQHTKYFQAHKEGRLPNYDLLLSGEENDSNASVHYF